MLNAIDAISHHKLTTFKGIEFLYFTILKKNLVSSYLLKVN